MNLADTHDLPTAKTRAISPMEARDRGHGPARFA